MALSEKECCTDLIDVRENEDATNNSDLSPLKSLFATTDVSDTCWTVGSCDEFKAGKGGDELLFVSLAGWSCVFLLF